MSEPTGPASSPSDTSPKWRPLDALQRRVLGVLIEKAKTTPDAYPLTINSTRTACNQKSNRDPQMDLDADDVEATLDELREMGAVAEIQGDGRAIKYRHLAYAWLGVDKTELAVMGELLLRGEQTVGELRGRAARMEPIAGLAELTPILKSLVAKQLITEVTPPGRGQVVTHNLYQEGQRPAARPQPAPAPAVSRQNSGPAAPPASSPPSSSASTATPSGDPASPLAELKSALQALEARVARLEQLSDRD